MKLRFPLLVGAALLACMSGVSAQAAEPTPRSVLTIQGHGPGACPYNRLCLYRDPGLNGASDAPILVTNQNIRGLGQYDFDDTTSSACNNTNYPALLNEHPNYEGRDFVVDPGDCTDLPNMFEDLISAVKVYS